MEQKQSSNHKKWVYTNENYFTITNQKQLENNVLKAVRLLNGNKQSQRGRPSNERGMT